MNNRWGWWSPSHVQKWQAACGLADLLNDGTIRVAINSTFVLTDARKAHERAAQGNIQVKIVLTVA